VKPLRNPLLKWERSDDGNVLIRVPVEVEKRRGKKLLATVAAAKERRVTLDRLGSFVWERLDGKHTVEQIVKEFCDEYKLMRQEAEASISTFLQQLSERGFVGRAVPIPKEEKGEVSALRKTKIS